MYDTVFKNERRYKREIGIISHKDYIIENNKYDIITNSQNIYEIIDFIRTSKVIITNSYHGIYWATLMKRKVITMGYLHSNKFEYFKYTPQKYSGNIIKDINNSKIYELALNESIDLTLNYFNEIKNYLKETQNNLYNINYNLTEKYYNDFQVWESFNNYIEAVDNDINNKLESVYKELNDKYNNIIQSVDNDINNKLESMYKELNDKYNNIVSVFNEIVDKVAWWIPFKKFRDNFRNKFRIVI